MVLLYAELRRLSCRCGHWRQSLFVCATLLAVVGCNKGSPPAAATIVSPTPAVTVLNVVIHDSYYGDQDDNFTHPPIWEAPAGGNVVLNIDNRGYFKHNWAIVKPGVAPSVPYVGGQDDQIIWYGAGMVYSENRTTVTFVAPDQPGEYLVICTVENHYPQMQGRLVVK